MAYTHLLWDFNGTILDDVEISVTSLNTLLERRGMKLLESKEAYSAIFGFPIIDYYKRAGFDFKDETFEAVGIEWLAEYEKNFPTAPIRAGVDEVIKKLNEMGIGQTVISASEENILKRQLQGLGIAGYFESINGINNIYASSKVGIAKLWLERTPHGKLLFVGDTVHDFDVATSIGADCLLMTGGHQNRETLKKCGCPVIDHPSEILEYLK